MAVCVWHPLARGPPRNVFRIRSHASGLKLFDGVRFKMQGFIKVFRTVARTVRMFDGIDGFDVYS